MAYVTNHLMENEKLVYMAPIHWAIYIPGIVLLSLGIIFVLLLNTQGLNFIGGFFILAGIILLIKAWIFKISTELAVTSKRIISKTGLIGRNTHEINHSKVESLHVDQSVLGRVLGYGTISIHGTGGGSAPIQNIDNPMFFRNKAMETIG